jgi:hypothetical protein
MKNLRLIEKEQLNIAKGMFGEDTKFARLLANHKRCYEAGMIKMHHLHDCTFFIVYNGEPGYRYVKFYNDGFNIRFGGHHASEGEAYSEACVESK